LEAIPCKYASAKFVQNDSLILIMQTDRLKDHLNSLVTYGEDVKGEICILSGR